MKSFPIDAFLYVVECSRDKNSQLCQRITDFIHSLFPPNYSNITIPELLTTLEQILPTKIQINNYSNLENFRVFVDKEKIHKLVKVLVKTLESNNQKIISSWLSFSDELEFKIPSLTINTTAESPKIHETIFIERILPIPKKFLNDCWCILTHGGKISFIENQVILYFSGLRDIYAERFIKSEYLEILEEIKNKKIQNISDLRERYIKNELISIKDIVSKISFFSNTICSFSLPSEIIIDSHIPLIFDTRAKWSALFLLLLNISPQIENFRHLLLQVSYQPNTRKIVVQNLFKSKVLSQKENEVLQKIINLIKEFSFEEETSIKNTGHMTEIKLSFYFLDKLGIFLDKEIPNWEYLSPESKEIIRKITHNYTIPEQHPLINEIIKFEVIQTFLELCGKSILVNISTELLNSRNRKFSSEQRRFLEHISKQKLKKSDLEINLIAFLINILSTDAKYFERLKCNLKFKEVDQQKLNKLSYLLTHSKELSKETLSEVGTLAKEVRVV
ncbi:MAG: hypothetical protein N3G21_10895 [Candidatus Hydrogenedentes bacterium]|nr:hypothetical protein [Candidatus Hydrogenedentota bacterium]